MTREIEVGETFRAVIVHPNTDNSRDPVAKVNNTTTWIRFEDKANDDISFGETWLCRMADKREDNYLAVAIERVDG